MSATEPVGRPSPRDDAARSPRTATRSSPGFHPDPSVCRVGERVLPGHLVVHLLAGCPGLPVRRPRWLDPDRQRARPPFAPRPLGDHPALVPRRLRPDPAAPRRALLADHDVFTDGARQPPRHRRRPGRSVVGAGARGPSAGIDPDLAWDPDGTCWVALLDRRPASSGAPSTRRAERCSTVPSPLWSGTGRKFPEAPAPVPDRRRDWYLLIAEGGTERGHSVSIARGPSPTGPWEGSPTNPILSHRSTDRPVQNTGHADLVEATDGSWWMVLLGTRPRGGSPGWHVLGRETFLAPVTWVDGWPQVDPVELVVDRRPPGPVDTVGAEHRDDFDGTTLDPRWIAVRQPPAALSSLDRRPGGSRCTAATPPSTRPSRPSSVADSSTSTAGRACSSTTATPRRQGSASTWTRATTTRSGSPVIEIVVRARIGPLDSVVARAARPTGPVVLVVETAPYQVPARRRPARVPRCRGPVRAARGARRSLPVHRGGRRDARPGPRGVRHRWRRGLRLVRLRRDLTGEAMDTRTEHLQLSYVSGPGDVPLIGRTIGDDLAATVARLPDREALVDVPTGRRWTYARARRRRRPRRARPARRWASRRATGSASGRRTAPSGSSSSTPPREIGAILVNINPAYRTHELRVRAEPGRRSACSSRRRRSRPATTRR